MHLLRSAESPQMSRRTPSPSVPQRAGAAAGPRRPSRVLSEAGGRETAGDYRCGLSVESTLCRVLFRSAVAAGCRRPAAASRDSVPQPSDRDEMWEEKRRKFLEKRRGQSPSTGVLVKCCIRFTLAWTFHPFMLCGCAATAFR
jgi:hypothetical protein